MKRQDIILHIINNSFNSVLIEYVDSNYSNDYPTFNSLNAFQKSKLYQTTNIVNEVRYNSFEESEHWMSDRAYDVTHP